MYLPLLNGMNEDVSPKGLSEIPGHAGQPARQPGSADASDPTLDQVIDDIERELATSDPQFVRRWNRLARAEVANAVHVVLLLVASAVLLGVGLATRSGVAWVAGAAAFVTSFGVDERYQRRFGVRHRARATQ